METDLIDLKNALENKRDLIRLKRKDTNFEVQIIGNAQGGFSLYFISEGVPAAVHISARGGASGEFTGRVTMPAGDQRLPAERGAKRDLHVQEPKYPPSRLPVIGLLLIQVALPVFVLGMVLTLIQGGDFVLAGGITALVLATTGGLLIFYGQEMASIRAANRVMLKKLEERLKERRELECPR